MAARAFNGPALRDQRRLAGLTAAQLAATVGRSEWTVWAYETGRVIPPVDVAASLADALDLRLDQLLTSAETAMVEWSASTGMRTPAPPHYRRRPLRAS